MGRTLVGAFGGQVWEEWARRVSRLFFDSSQCVLAFLFEKGKTLKNTSTLLGYSLAFMLPAFVEAANFNVAAGDVYGPQGLVAAINAANQSGGKIGRAH